MSVALNYSDSRPTRGGAFSFDHYRGRMIVVLVVFALIVLGLIARAAQLQLVSQDFYEDQGKARYTRVAKLAAHRGAILDRNGETLAVSTPVDTVWVNPRELQTATDQYKRLAEALNRDVRWLTQRVSSNLDREFLSLVRHMRPDDAAQVKALKIPGVYLQREYRRYYPAGEVTGHILGFTSVDDGGQEGLELAYDYTLAGEEGKKRVIRDLKGNTVEDIESIRPARPGNELVTSIDLRIQYLAYRELKAAIEQHHAQSGSMVIVDVDTGEVLAMVNQPGFNPNDREQLEVRSYKNRAATDIFEPGSSIKPFIATAGVLTGRYSADTVIDTSPGYIQVGNKRFPDTHNNGAITLTTVLAKSSNVGMTKMALTLSRDQMWQTLDAFGFGHVTASGYPGESAGMLAPASQWRTLEQATISFGYGLSVTPLQLAHAYAVLGTHGIDRPISLRRIDGPVEGRRVVDEHVAREMLSMMEHVVTQEGATGGRAALDGYRVAGKTGTAWKAKVDSAGYDTDHFRATFGGVVPASNPKLAAIVMIDDPAGASHTGGEVSAPVFANVMAGALRLLGVPADNLDSIPESRRDNTLLQASDFSPAAPISRDTSRSDLKRKTTVKAPAKPSVRTVDRKAQTNAAER
jgi:cell division protein FtsI (penicillin-binding protein 3)